MIPLTVMFHETFWMTSSPGLCVLDLGYRLTKVAAFVLGARCDNNL